MSADKVDPAFLVITEEGLKEVWKRMRREERCIRGTGEERVVK